MHLIKAQNVNEALYVGSLFMKEHGRPVSSRYGDTLEIGTTVTEYYNPTERVLFAPERDANPFFHLMEAVWILAGRRDVPGLTRYNKRMAEFSDDGVVFHGAYGYRLRHAQGFDQIKAVIRLLRADPGSRRAVLQIWDARKDLLEGNSKDIPCNDLVMLKIRDGRLDITVACRSNDMIWGAYGANAVQFSVLQEYIAAHLGVPVGIYRQVSDSFHVYTDGPGGAAWERAKHAPWLDPYETIRPFPLVSMPGRWDRELVVWQDDGCEGVYHEPFFADVLAPMEIAWTAYKAKDRRGALAAADAIAADDWRRACREWLERRYN